MTVNENGEGEEDEEDEEKKKRKAGLETKLVPSVPNPSSAYGT